MEIKTNTKFNLDDRVQGTATMRDNEGKYKSIKFEGQITDIVVEYGKYSDRENHDKVVLKEQYNITYKAKTDDDVLVTCPESSLSIIKRSLDYFTTEELEEEISKRKANWPCDDSQHLEGKIGELYDDGIRKGIVCAVDKKGKPSLIISLTEENRTFTWDEAMEWGNSLKDGWHIPTKEELKLVWDNNYVSDLVKQGIKKYNGIPIEPKFYWGSSQYSTAYAYRVYAGNGLVYNSHKYDSLYVRPFASLS